MIDKNFLNIELDGSDDKKHKLADYKGKNIVLYFYPKDDTPGCTIQGSEYTSYLDTFTKHNTVVIGASRDDVDSKKHFCNKRNYKHLLLADIDLELCKAFKVTKGFKMFGKEKIGIRRSSFVIDTNGNVIKENYDCDFSKDAENNLNFIKTIA